MDNKPIIMDNKPNQIKRVLYSDIQSSGGKKKDKQSEPAIFLFNPGHHFIGGLTLSTENSCNPESVLSEIIDLINSDLVSRERAKSEANTDKSVIPENITPADGPSESARSDSIEIGSCWRRNGEKSTFKVISLESDGIINLSGTRDEDNTPSHPRIHIGFFLDNWSPVKKRKSLQKHDLWSNRDRLNSVTEERSWEPGEYQVIITRVGKKYIRFRTYRPDSKVTDKRIYTRTKKEFRDSFRFDGFPTRQPERKKKT